MDIVIPKEFGYRVPVYNDSYGVINVGYSSEKLAKTIFLHLASMLKTGGKCTLEYEVKKCFYADAEVLTGTLRVLEFEGDIIHAV